MTREEILAKIQQLMAQREQAFATMHQLTGMIAAFEAVLAEMPTAANAVTESPADETGGDDAADR